MASFVNGCVFTAASAGTGAFVVSAAVTGWQTPAQASAVDGASYRYRAWSSDQTQWEIGTGVYTAGTTTLTRAVIDASSNGGAATNFTAAPSVALTMFGADFVNTGTLGTGVATFLATPSSANLAAALTDKTGTGVVVFSAGPALTGTPTAPTAAADTNTTQIATTAMVLGQAAAATPLGNAATAVVGTSTRYARADHVHPGREVLVANRTYYVRTDGSNSNDGLTNTAGGAFLTLQKAWDTICDTLDLAGFQVTIQLGDGTYTTGIASSKGPVGGAASDSVVIQGNTSNAGSVILSVTSNSIFQIGGGVGANFQVTLRYMELRTITSGNCINAFGGSCYIKFNNLRFGSCAGIHIYAAHAAFVIANGNYEVVGNATYHAFAQTCGIIAIHGVTVTFSNTPAFTIFAITTIGGQFFAASCTFTNGGTVTGIRFYTATQALIDIGGIGTLTYLPGNASGVIAAGGIYDGIPAAVGGDLGAVDNRLLRADGTGAKTAQGSAATLDDSGNLSGLGTVAATGVVTVGATSGGTYSGNTVIVPNDQYPGITWRAAAVAKALMIADVNAGAVYFDAPGGLNFRDTINGGNTMLQIAAARLTAGIPLKMKSYTVATLPTGQAGDTAFASNGRALAGSTGAANLTVQGAGAGTGCLAVHNGTNWQVAGLNTTVAA